MEAIAVWRNSRRAAVICRSVRFASVSFLPQSQQANWAVSTLNYQIRKDLDLVRIIEFPVARRMNNGTNFTVAAFA